MGHVPSRELVNEPFTLDVETKNGHERLVGLALTKHHFPSSDDPLFQLFCRVRGETHLRNWFNRPHGVPHDVLPHCPTAESLYQFYVEDTTAYVEHCAGINPDQWTPVPMLIVKMTGGIQEVNHPTTENCSVVGILGCRYFNLPASVSTRQGLSPIGAPEPGLALLLLTHSMYNEAKTLQCFQMMCACYQHFVRKVASSTSTDDVMTWPRCLVTPGVAVHSYTANLPLLQLALQFCTLAPASVQASAHPSNHDAKLTDFLTLRVSHPEDEEGGAAAAAAASSAKPADSPTFSIFDLCSQVMPKTFPPGDSPGADRKNQYVLPMATPTTSPTKQDQHADLTPSTSAKLNVDVVAGLVQAARKVWRVANAVVAQEIASRTKRGAACPKEMPVPNPVAEADEGVLSLEERSNQEGAKRCVIPVTPPMIGVSSGEVSFTSLPGVMVNPAATSITGPPSVAAQSDGSSYHSGGYLVNHEDQSIVTTATTSRAPTPTRKPPQSNQIHRQHSHQRNYAIRPPQYDEHLHIVAQQQQHLHITGQQPSYVQQQQHRRQQSQHHPIVAEQQQQHPPRMANKQRLPYQHQPYSTPHTDYHSHDQHGSSTPPSCHSTPSSSASSASPPVPFKGAMKCFLGESTPIRVWTGTEWVSDLWQTPMTPVYRAVTQPSLAQGWVAYEPADRSYDTIFLNAGEIVYEWLSTGQYNPTEAA